MYQQFVNGREVNGILVDMESLSFGLVIYTRRFVGSKEDSGRGRGNRVPGTIVVVGELLPHCTSHPRVPSTPPHPILSTPSVRTNRVELLSPMKGTDTVSSRFVEQTQIQQTVPSTLYGPCPLTTPKDRGHCQSPNPSESFRDLPGPRKIFE